MASNEDAWQRARLFPVTGIGGEDEQERRAASALLAVLAAVREFGRTLTMRLGAPAGSEIETFIELPMTFEGKKYRPDGLIRVTRGKRVWTVLVEVKTGRNRLTGPQVATYLDIARQEGFDGLLTISHEIPTSPGEHPVTVDGRKLRGNISLHHLSWGQIHTEALIEQLNRSVSDPDQAWILSEFIRYLEDPKAGTIDFNDMGPSWATVRDNATKQTLRAGDEDTRDVAARFEQLLTFAGMSLSRRLGVHVHPVLTKRERENPAARLQTAATTLAKTGLLRGGLRVPGAIAPLDVVADLRAGRIDCSATIDAPTGGRPITRLNWLVRQLQGGPASLQLRANLTGIKDLGPTCALADLVGEQKVLVDNSHVGLRSFTLTLSQTAGTRSGQGKGSFVTSVVTLVDDFYTSVVQGLKPWAASAPRAKQFQPDTDVAIDGPYAESADDVTGQPVVESLVAEMISDRAEDDADADFAGSSKAHIPFEETAQDEGV